MKKFFVVLGLVVFVVCGCLCFGLTDKTTYLRIRITSNSLRQEDKDIKYAIKDKVVEFLTPYIKECESYDEVYNLIDKNLLTISCIIDGLLTQNNLDYKCEAQMENEYFPTRNYGEVTVESGFYDAVSISLGEAKGDNWWCVLYPPLCFNDVGFGEVKYKSGFLDLISVFLYKERR